MLNKEKYKNEIWKIVCTGSDIAVNGFTGKPESCDELGGCSSCLFHHSLYCTSAFVEWCEKEYNGE